MDQLEYFPSSLKGVFLPLSPEVDRCQPVRGQPLPWAGALGKQGAGSRGERPTLPQALLVQLSFQTHDWKGSLKTRSKGIDKCQKRGKEW